MKLQAQPWLLLKWALKEQAVSIQRAPFLEGFMKKTFLYFILSAQSENSFSLLY